MSVTKSQSDVQQPVHGARVTVMGIFATDTTLFKVTLTDTTEVIDGDTTSFYYARAHIIPGGSYVVSVAKDGYPTATASVIVPYGYATIPDPGTYSILRDPKNAKSEINFNINLSQYASAEFVQMVIEYRGLDNAGNLHAGSFNVFPIDSLNPFTEIGSLVVPFTVDGLVDSVVNQGLPAPLDIQVSDNDLGEAYGIAQKIALQLKDSKRVSDVLIPQDIDYPGLELNIDREQASLLGLTPKDVVDNVITALTSDGMIAPSYWIDPKSGNNYMLTVQYSNEKMGSMTMSDFRNIPLRAATSESYTPLQSVAKIQPINTPTEVDHYQIRRVIDVFVMPKSEDLSGVNGEVQQMLKRLTLPRNARVRVQGAVVGMSQSFARFGVGLLLSVVLVYLILMAQFRSFIDPFIILTAIPPGLAGALVFLWMTHTTLNIMSLMGVIMMTGIVVSNSILIVEFSGILHERGMELKQAVVEACKVRLRPILMTSLATLLGVAADGAGCRGRQRTVCATRALHDRGAGGLRCINCVPGAGCLSGDSRQEA